MDDNVRESWRKIAKVLPLDGLERLRDALRNDDHKLVQIATTVPAFDSLASQICEGGCAIGYAFTNGINTTESVRESFRKVRDEVDPSYLFTYWFDMTPRDEMRRELLPEVERAIQEREGAA